MQLGAAERERRAVSNGDLTLLLFAILPNASYRHFNGSGLKRALITTTTNAPMMLNLFHNERFVFDNPFFFDDRVGKKEYFAGEGACSTWCVRATTPGKPPSLGACRTTDLPDLLRSAEVAAATPIFLLADSLMHRASFLEMPALRVGIV